MTNWTRTKLLWVHRKLALKDATMALTQAEGIVASALHAASHFDALATAAHYRISAYDAHYLVVARNLGVKLVTEDARLRKSAPELTQSLAQEFQSEQLAALAGEEA